MFAFGSDVRRVEPDGCGARYPVEHGEELRREKSNTLTHLVSLLGVVGLSIAFTNGFQRSVEPRGIRFRHLYPSFHATAELDGPVLRVGRVGVRTLLAARIPIDGSVRKQCRMIILLHGCRLAYFRLQLGSLQPTPVGHCPMPGQTPVLHEGAVPTYRRWRICGVVASE